MMFIVRSPVRISFADGDTDLPAYFKNFGNPVLSTAINKYFYTILVKRREMPSFLTLMRLSNWQ